MKNLITLARTMFQTLTLKIQNRIILTIAPVNSRTHKISSHYEADDGR